MKWNLGWLVCFFIFAHLSLITDVSGAEDQTFEGCRSQVEIAYCYQPDRKTTECYRNTGSWRNEIRKIYGLYPAYLQRVMCSLNFIALYGSMNTSGKAFCDREIAIQAGVYFFDLSLSEWATWKEQLPFYPHRSDYGHDSEGLVVRAQMDWDVNTAIAFILTHELGHIIDAKIKATDTDSSGIRSCPPWEDGPSLNFPRLCYYYCDDKPLAQEEFHQLFQKIIKSRFLSAYSTSNSSEHFAETFAFYVLTKYANLDYSVWYRGQELLNVTERLESQEFHDIVAFMDSLESRLEFVSKASCPDIFGSD